MQKSLRSEYPEIDDIKADVKSLQENVVALSKHVKTDGQAEANRLSDIALERIAELRQSARDEMTRAERRVQERPGQSIAIAVAAGFLLSMLFGRK